MSADLYFVSCYQDSAPVRTDLLTDNPGPVYWFGDLVYMDATVGTKNGQWKSGVVGGAAHWPENGSGFRCTVGGVPTTANGLAGQLPVTTWTVVAPGTGYPDTQAFAFGGGLAVELTPAGGGPGSGATGLALTHLVLTAGVANGATSATLVQAPAAGNGTRNCTFANGQVRSCTFTGTAVTFAAMSGGGSPTTLSDGLGQIQIVTPNTGGFGYTSGASDQFTFSRHNGTRGNWYARVAQVMSFKPFYDYLQKRKELGLKWYFMHDDHEYFNNWCHAVSNAPVGITTLAQTLDFWREASAAWQGIVPQWFDNASRPNSSNGDMPASMVGVVGRLGVATPADFPLWDFVHDYDAAGNLTYGGAGPGGTIGAALAFKVIGIDCISAKSPIATVDSATKYMIGPQQEQRVYDAVQDAVKRKAKHIILMTGKDFFNLDNTDGWGVPTDGSTHYPYIVQRDRFLQTIHNLLVGSSTGIIYISGDRHCPHVAVRSLDLGNTYNAFVICGTPWGSNSMGLTTTGYTELLHWNPDVDPVVHTVITYSEELNATVVRIVDSITGRDRSRWEFPWGASLPLMSGMRTRRKLADFKTVAGAV